MNIIYLYMYNIVYSHFVGHYPRTRPQLLFLFLTQKEFSIFFYFPLRGVA